MTAKEYLGQVRRKDVRINNLQKQKDRLCEMLYSLGNQNSSGERVQTSAVRDKLGDLFAKIDEKERQILKEIDELVDFTGLVTEQINNLPDERYTEVLYKRYLEYKTLGRIAQEMDYSYDYIRRIHGNALKEFEKVNPQIKEVTQCHI